jgi:hypothetical protein
MQISCCRTLKYAKVGLQRHFNASGRGGAVGQSDVATPDGAIKVDWTATQARCHFGAACDSPAGPFDRAHSIDYRLRLIGITRAVLARLGFFLRRGGGRGTREYQSVEPLLGCGRDRFFVNDHIQVSVAHSRKVQAMVRVLLCLVGGLLFVAGFCYVSGDQVQYPDVPYERTNIPLTQTSGCDRGYAIGPGPGSCRMVAVTCIQSVSYWPESDSTYLSCCIGSRANAACGPEGDVAQTQPPAPSTFLIQNAPCAGTTTGFDCDCSGYFGFGTCITGPGYTLPCTGQKPLGNLAC